MLRFIPYGSNEMAHIIRYDSYLMPLRLMGYKLWPTCNEIGFLESHSEWIIKFELFKSLKIILFKWRYSRARAVKWACPRYLPTICNAHYACKNIGLSYIRRVKFDIWKFQFLFLMDQVQQMSAIYQVLNEIKISMSFESIMQVD